MKKLLLHRRCDLGLDQVGKFLKWISLKVYFSKIDIENFELVGVLKLLENKWPQKFIQIIPKKYWLIRYWLLSTIENIRILIKLKKISYTLINVFCKATEKHYLGFNLFDIAFQKL